MSRASAARVASGIGAGRFVARSTKTWVKRPAAAACAAPALKIPIP